MFICFLLSRFLWFWLISVLVYPRTKLWTWISHWSSIKCALHTVVSVHTNTITFERSWNRKCAHLMLSVSPKNSKLLPPNKYIICSQVSILIFSLWGYLCCLLITLNSGNTLNSVIPLILAYYKIWVKKTEFFLFWILESEMGLPLRCLVLWSTYTMFTQNVPTVTTSLFQQSTYITKFTDPFTEHFLFK